MTADDRTQHVLDAIDGALADWSVSPDAMRWTPEPPAPRPIPIGAPGEVSWLSAAPRPDQPITIGWDGSRDTASFVFALRLEAQMLAVLTDRPPVIITTVY